MSDRASKASEVGALPMAAVKAADGGGGDA